MPAANLQPMLVYQYRLWYYSREMQTPPYVIITSPQISQVYELYYKSLEGLRESDRLRY